MRSSSTTTRSNGLKGKRHERHGRAGDGLRRRQPLLGGERRVHPLSQPGVRRAWGGGAGGRRAHAVHGARRPAPVDPRAGRREPAAAAGCLSRPQRPIDRGDAHVRGPETAPRVVQPRRPPSGHGRPGRRGVLHVPVPGRVHGGPDAARRGGDPRHLPRVQPLARRRVGLRLPRPDLRRAVPDAVGPRRRHQRAGLGAGPRRADRRRASRPRVHRGRLEVAGRPDVRSVLGTRGRSTTRGRLPSRFRRRLSRRRERGGPLVGLREPPPPGRGVVAELLRADRRRVDGAPVDPRLHGGGRRARGCSSGIPGFASRASRTACRGCATRRRR